MAELRMPYLNLVLMTGRFVDDPHPLTGKDDVKGAAFTRKSTARTTSSIRPKRPRSVCFRIASRSAALSSPQPRVPSPWRDATNPSINSFTRTSGAALRAQASVRDPTARLAAA